MQLWLPSRQRRPIPFLHELAETEVSRTWHSAAVSLQTSSFITAALRIADIFGICFSHQYARSIGQYRLIVPEVNILQVQNAELGRKQKFGL